ncbi:MAG: hypothetical protein ORN83_15095 [Chthoniobacteraceae bacterium]|jgi:hypothetical protein|nr:hypothetical protein [Chthoniobacteraceae bacterium]
MKTRFAVSTIIFTFFIGAPLTFAKKKDGSQTTTGTTYGMERFDLNQNGILENDEKAAIKQAFAEGDVAAKMLDTNKNGILDDSEIAAIKLPPPPKKKKKNKE